MHILSRVSLAILLFTSAAAAQVDRRTGSATAAEAAKGIQRASTVLQLDYDPNRSGGQRTIETQTLIAMLTSTTLVDPAACSSSMWIASPRGRRRAATVSQSARTPAAPARRIRPPGG